MIISLKLSFPTFFCVRLFKGVNQLFYKSYIIYCIVYYWNCMYKFLNFIIKPNKEQHSSAILKYIICIDII